MLKIVSTIWLKIRHPSVKTNQYHSVRPGTEIILRKGGRLILGKNVITRGRVTFSVKSGVLRIGKDISFNCGDIVACMQDISIGDDCAFGPNVVIYDHDHQFSGKGFAVKEFNCSPVVIEDHVWVGANAVILRGTHIGRGCVIGAGAVVKGDIPAHSLVKGDRKITVEPIKEEKK